ncbi:hypothetical protein [Vagococcus sp.]|uniref:hypothetical protein n=1 Tax=Vagococcus sp. TaxID=1933889 RepID=UPI002FCA5B4B
MGNITTNKQLKELITYDVRKEFISYSLNLVMSEVYLLDKETSKSLKKEKINKKAYQIYLISFISMDSPSLFNRFIVCSGKLSNDEVEVLVFKKFNRIKEVKNIEELGKAIKLIE